MRFTEDNSINIDDIEEDEICYIEYEKHDDIIVEKAIKNNKGFLETLRYNKVIKDYIGIYRLEGD